VKPVRIEKRIDPGFWGWWPIRQDWKVRQWAAHVTIHYPPYKEWPATTSQKVVLFHWNLTEKQVLELLAVDDALAGAEFAVVNKIWPPKTAEDIAFLEYLNNKLKDKPNAAAKSKERKPVGTRNLGRRRIPKNRPTVGMSLH
jgi:hypothetical protein